MSVREYVGARYVPTFANPIEWSSANSYEPLTIVLYQGNSYTSRQAVPSGVDITNSTYWAQTGNYNAQIEQYRQDIIALQNRFPVSVVDGGTGGTDASTARTNLDAAQSDGASTTLYSVEQAIALNTGSIIMLQDSMDAKSSIKTVKVNNNEEVHPLSFRWRKEGNNKYFLDAYIDSQRVGTFRPTPAGVTSAAWCKVFARKSITVPANNGASIDIPLSIPGGFRGVALANANTSNAGLLWVTWTIINSDTAPYVHVYIRNITSASITSNIEIHVLCLRDIEAYPY